MKYISYDPTYTSLIPDYQVEQCQYEPYSPDYSNYVADYRIDIDFTTSASSIVPLFKYYGGKRKLLTYNAGIARFFVKCENYVEPFIGAGAAYCYMSNNAMFKKAIINDNDDDLVNLLIAIRDNCHEIVACLTELLSTFPQHADGEARRDHIHRLVEPYYTGKCSSIERSALFYILRRNWFNGMHKGRSNNRGDLSGNGPQSPANVQNLINWKRALQNTEITCSDYKSIAVPENAFVYVDPPYLATNKEYRDGYKHDFSNAEQMHCINWCRSISSVTVKVVLSNSNAETLHQYLAGFADIHEISVYYSSIRKHATEMLAVFK